MNFYNPEETLLKHVPVEEKLGKIEIICLKNGVITDTLTGVDIQETVKIVEKVIEVYEGILIE